MEAALMMGAGGSTAAYLKLQVSSCKHNVDMMISPLLLHHHHPRNTKDDVGLIKLLSISSSSSSVVSTNCSSTTTRTSSVFRLRPVSCSSSSSHTHHHLQLQSELDNHKSLNGHTSTNIKAETETVRVTFQLHKQCSFGHNFLLTGDDRVLGLWDPNNAVPLTWSEGHLWTSAHLDIPIGKCIKFKFILQESDGVIVWQPGPDRVLECFKTDKTMTLCEDWEDPDLRKIIEIEQALNQEIIQMVEAASGGETLIQPLVRGNGTDQEPKVVCATNMMKQVVLVSDEGVVPVLVPGLNQYQEDSVNVASNDEHGSLNGSAMASTEPDMLAKDLILPELDLKGEANTSTLNPRPKMTSSVHEIQDSSDQNKHHQQQQQQQATEEEQVTTQYSLHHNDIVKWGHNAVQKLLSIIFGIQ